MIAGSSCELWFSAEAFAAINWAPSQVLLAGQCMYNEPKKQDLTIYDGDVESSKLLCAIEAKVIHDFSNKKRDDLIERLKEQIERNIKKSEEDCLHGGIVYVLWSSRHKHLECPEFLSKVDLAIAKYFPKESFNHYPTTQFDEIVPLTELKWGAEPFAFR